MTDTSTALEWKGKGNAALSAGNHTEAIDCYTKAIELDNSQHVFFSNRSAGYLSNNEPSKALDDANVCIKLKSDWPKGYCRKGAALHKLKQYPEAIAAYEAGLQVDPSNAACQSGIDEVNLVTSSSSANPSNPLGNLFGPGVENRMRANPKIAHLANDPSFMAILAQLQQNPNSINVHLKDQRVMLVLTELMGINTATEPMAEPTKKEDKKTSAAAPTPAPTPMEVEETGTEAEQGAKRAKTQGNEFYKQKNFSEALKCYDEAIALDPTNMSFLSNRAAVRFEMKDYDECIADCQQAIQIGRENRADYALVAKAYVRIGNAYLKKGDDFLDDAIVAFETAQVENRTRAVELKIKNVLLQSKKAKAKAYIDPVKGLEAKTLGNDKFKNGEFPQAVELYSEAIKRDPENPVYYANRAAAYTKLTSFNEAKSDCDKALALDPTYVKAWSRLGAIQCFMKEYHKAMESYKKGVSLDAQNVECQQGLARVMAIIQNTKSGEVDQERQAHAMADPEIQDILRDPVIQNVLQDFQTDPKAAQRHLQNKGIMEKIEKLIAAGVLKTN